MKTYQLTKVANLTCVLFLAWLFIGCSEYGLEEIKNKELKEATKEEIENGKDLLVDTKVPIDSGKASSHQTGEDIAKSFDGNMKSLYHSSWNNSGKNYFPITLDYFFKEQDRINYFIYYPRTSGRNGNFKEVEIWVATESEPTLKKVIDYDFQGAGTSTKVYFPNMLEKPTQVRFVVKSGTGTGIGFAACAEMEFYSKNPKNLDPLTIFTDLSCSELKSDITADDISKISNGFYRHIAGLMLKNKYSREFRIDEYRAWPDPRVWSRKNKTYSYSLLDNPTGIRVNEGEKLIVFLGDTKGYRITLQTHNLGHKPDGYWAGSANYPLSQGVNIIKVRKKGLCYILYHTKDYKTAPKIKIHFATGEVNGYFDSEKHSASDWSRLLNAATDDYFDLLGKNAHLTFPTKSFRTYASNNGPELIAAYDDLVRLEHEFMGLMKYNRPTINRAYFHVMYKPGVYYATNYRTAYNSGGLYYLLDVNRLRKSMWGPAHELGHVNQTRPGFRWKGMTEVSNNVYSLYVQTEWGNQSRLETENKYEQAYYTFFVENTKHGELKDPFPKLVPFWQLQLYFAKVKGYVDFYKDLYEQIRLRSNPPTAGKCQLNFVKLVCEITKTDLTGFFKKWGMLSPIDREINDYGKGWMKITQAEVDDLISSIKSKGYDTPDASMHYICDSNWQNFNNKARLAKGTATYSDKTKTFKMSGWGNVVAYEVWDGGKLVYATNKDTFTIDKPVSNSKEVYVLAYDGETTIVSFK